MKSPRRFLHAARLADGVLFWPVLAFVIWGELTSEVPPLLSSLEDINDKLLHFLAYFVLGSMASGALKARGAVKWAVLALILVGAALELIQAYVGRDTSILDGLANATGAVAGALFARMIIDPLRRRWEER